MAHAVALFRDWIIAPADVHIIGTAQFALICANCAVPPGVLVPEDGPCHADVLIELVN